MMRSLAMTMCLAPALALAVPLELQHQGRVLDSSGTGLNETLTVDVHLYDQATLGTSLWSQRSSIIFNDGYFAMQLTGFEADDFDGSTRYLTLIVDDVELGPRTPVLSVPYAVRAGSVAGDVQVGNGDGNCDGTPEGSFDWDGSELRFCDGTEFQRVSLHRDDGSAQESAATTCATLHANYPSLNSGTYWVDPDGDSLASDAFQVWCDMDTDGGGWTVITNNDNTDNEPSGCFGRIASHPDLPCGTGGPEDSDWGVPAWDFTFTELVWAAYTGSYNVTSYNAMEWNTVQDMPNTAIWNLVPDNQLVTIADWSALPKIYCTSSSVNTLASVGNRYPLTTTFGTTTPVTLWGGSTTNDELHMSFTEHGASGSQRGLDDWQDGSGCSDSWVPTSNNGYSSFVMIR